MATRILHTEYREEQAAPRYPFADTANLQSNDGRSIPPDVFLDASLYPIGSGPRLFLAAITIATSQITFSLSDVTYTTLATAAFDPLAPPSLLQFTDQYGRPAGILVAQPSLLNQFRTWPVGRHTFPLGATEFVASCVIPTPEPGVRGILTETGDLLTGDVWLVGDRGVVLRRDDDGAIRIDVVGDPLYIRQLCEQVDRFSSPLFVRTINGYPPDKHGNFNLTVGSNRATKTVIRIYPAGDGLTIEAVGGPAVGER